MPCQGTALLPPFAVSYFIYRLLLFDTIITKINRNFFEMFIATATPFRLIYHTNGDETTTDTKDAIPVDGVAVTIPTNGNRGFCLNFKNQ